MRLPVSVRVWSMALALVALAGAGCRGDGAVEPESAPEAAAAPTPGPPETGADALAVRAAVADFLQRKPDEIEWDAPLSSYGLDGLDASDLLMVVESALDIQIHNEDLEALAGSADVGGLGERLTTRIVVRLAERGREARTAKAR